MHFYFVGVRRCITLRQHLSHLRLFPLLLFSTAFATLFPSCCFSIRCSCSTLWYCQSLVRGSFTSSSSSSSSSSSRFARSRTLSHPPDILLRVCTYGSLSALSSTLSLSLSLSSFFLFLSLVQATWRHQPARSSSPCVAYEIPTRVYVCARVYAYVAVVFDE